MYIKADCKKRDLGAKQPGVVRSGKVDGELDPDTDEMGPNDTDASTPRSRRADLHEKLKQLPQVITPKSLRDELDRVQQSKAARRYHVLNGDTNLSSLKFLHKPQRVAHLNEDRFPEDELQRNTDLNKKLTTSNGFPELQPSSVMEERNIESINYVFNNTSNESVIPFPTPVYKKSGELVRSSLKKRSKSLPSTPMVKSHSEDSESGPGEDNPLLLSRSKSVHFDHKTPVKYFSTDESPSLVNTADEQNNSLSFMHKPVNLMDYGLAAEDDNGLLSGLRNMRMNDKFTSLDSLPKSEPKKLRKSKRFQDAIAKEKEQEKEKEKENTEPNVNSNNGDGKPVSTTSNIISKPAPKIAAASKAFNDSLVDVSESDAQAQNVSSTSSAPTRVQKVVGLYNKNFPILSNKNPKSLKLNIFINLSQGKKCFLQELTLHIQARQNLANGVNQQDPNSSVSRYILGKVLVKNVYYDKRVIVRYTWDAWKTASEVEGIWLSNSDSILPGTNMDIFHFLIDDNGNCRDEAAVGHLEFCIQYTTRDDCRREEYWDNNDGGNYKVDVVLRGFTNPFEF